MPWGLVLCMGAEGPPPAPPPFLHNNHFPPYTHPPHSPDSPPPPPPSPPPPKTTPPQQPPPRIKPTYPPPHPNLPPPPHPPPPPPPHKWRVLFDSILSLVSVEVLRLPSTLFFLGNSAPEVFLPYSLTRCVGTCFSLKFRSHTFPRRPRPCAPFPSVGPLPFFFFPTLNARRQCAAALLFSPCRMAAKMTVLCLSLFPPFLRSPSFPFFSPGEPGRKATFEE